METTTLAHHCLQILTSGVYFQLELNEIPLRDDAAGEGLSTTLQVNKWLRAGMNHLRVVVAGLMTPDAPATEISRAHLFVAEVDDQGAASVGETLAEFDWPGQLGLTYPYRFDAEVNIDRAPPTRLWDDAEVMEALTDDDQAEILKGVEAYRAAVLDGRVDDALELFAYRIAETEIADGHGPGGLRDVMAHQMGMGSRAKGCDCPPLRAGEAVLELVGGGRIVRPHRPGERCALTFENEQVSFGAEVYFAKVDGAWRIVR
ncbi:MAG: hypothetical protein ACYS22_21190 [Planctomycetota bacterium]|jgi:hypothetical protein